MPTLAEHTTDPEEHIDTLLERREHMAQFISRHPSYDVSLFLFRQTNAARRLCQKLVPPPAGGERIFGRPASPAASFGLKAVIYLSVIGASLASRRGFSGSEGLTQHPLRAASVVIAAIATPAYRRERYDPDGELSWPWYDVADCFLAFVFVSPATRPSRLAVDGSLTLPHTPLQVFEFVVKVVADGFMLGPNAYLRSLWNAIDGLVLVGLLVNTVTTITSDGGLSNFTRSLKAVRCLRLITLSSRLRSTLYSILVGIPRILDASVLVVLYMIVRGFASRPSCCARADPDLVSVLTPALRRLGRRPLPRQALQLQQPGGERPRRLHRRVPRDAHRWRRRRLPLAAGVGQPLAGRERLGLRRLPPGTSAPCDPRLLAASRLTPVSPVPTVDPHSV